MKIQEMCLLKRCLCYYAKAQYIKEGVGLWMVAGVLSADMLVFINTFKAGFLLFPASYLA